MGGLELFGWGVLGGFGAEAAMLFEIRHRLPSEFPHWMKSVAYWVIALVMVLLGGGMAVAHSRSGNSFNALLAIQIGASTPLILRQLTQTVPAAVIPPAANKID